MKELSLNTVQTMTLKEITDLLEVRHNNAMIAVRKMSEEAEFGRITEIQYSSIQGKEFQTYQLDKRQSIDVSKFGLIYLSEQNNF